MFEKIEIPSLVPVRVYALICMFGVGMMISACDFWPKVARTAVDLAPCAMDEYSLVEDAIRDPSQASTYLSIVGELLHCAPAVIRDLEASASQPSAMRPTLVAGKSGALYTTEMSLEMRRRIRAIKLLLRSVRTLPNGGE